MEKNSFLPIIVAISAILCTSSLPLKGHHKDMMILPAQSSGDDLSFQNDNLSKTVPVTTDNIKFHLDFVNIEEGVKADEIMFIKDLLVPMAIDRIKSFVSVTGTHQVGPLSYGSCQDEDIPNVDPKYYSQTLEGDMILFVGIRKLHSGILAYSGTCAQDPSSRRPVAGQVIFNSLHAGPKTHFLLNSYATLMHEIFHTIAFNPVLYSSFSPVSNGYAYFLNGGSYFMIGNELVSQAKKHFNCLSLDSLKMENEGDSGSSGAHFERLHFGNETMVSEDIDYPVLSVFTLAFLKDTGFYSIDLEKAQVFDWGKNRGCDFLDENICHLEDQYPEICSIEGSLDCDSTHNFITRCKKTKFTNNCYINSIAYGCQMGFSFDHFKSSQDYPKSISSFGKEARCVNYSKDGKSSATCAKVECAVDGLSYNVSFPNSTTFKCASKNEEIDFEGFKIRCLDPKEFCEIKPTCPDNCNFNGECNKDGSCWCLPFFGGDACEKYVGCPEGLEDICGDLLDKNLFDHEANYLITFMFLNIILFFVND